MYRFLDPDIESMILLMVRNTVMIQRDNADIFPDISDGKQGTLHGSSSYRAV